jgi:hypothetical protein
MEKNQKEFEDRKIRAEEIGGYTVKEQKKMDDREEGREKMEKC